MREQIALSHLFEDIILSLGRSEPCQTASNANPPRGKGARNGGEASSKNTQALDD